MRPCQACGAAVQNNQQECPECGAGMPTKRTAGPPPETGPGISGGPEETWEMVGILVMPVIVTIVGSAVAVSLWGLPGVFAGLLAGAVTFMVAFLLHTL